MQAGRGTIDMKTFKQDIRLKPVSYPLGGLRRWGQGQNKTFFFPKYSHVPYPIKADDACSNMVANILPIDTQSTPWWSSKVKPFFSESSHVAYQIKRI